jgi:type I restriction enzyme S subunit
MIGLPRGWVDVEIDELLAPLEDGRTLHQGWSPQCEKYPRQSEDEWGVLKTTAIQPGRFVPEHNKRLPDHLEPRPLIEVRCGDILITCAGPS